MTSQRGSESMLQGLLDRIRDGDEDALSQLLLQYQAFIRKVAYVSMDRGLAAKIGGSDLAQETLFDAFRGLPEFKGQTSAELRAWLRRLVKNNKIDVGRKFRDTRSRSVEREVPIENAGPLISREPTGSSYLRRSERDEMLAIALKELSLRDREILELRHHLGFGFAEIGERVGLTEGSARKQWSRIVESLGYKLNSEDL